MPNLIKQMRTNVVARALCAAALATLVSSAAVAAPAYTLVGPLVLPANGKVTSVRGLNNQRQSAAQVRIGSATKASPYLLSPGAPVSVSVFLSGLVSAGFLDITNQSWIAGYECISLPVVGCEGEAGVWKTPGAFTSLGAGFGSVATGANSVGTVVGYVPAPRSSAPLVFKIFSWNAGKLTWLTPPPGATTPQTSGIADDGTMAVTDGALNLYLLKDGAYTKVTPVGTRAIFAEAMSSNGYVAGEVSLADNAPDRVYLIRNGQLQLLPPVQQTSSLAGNVRGVNAQGQVLLSSYLWRDGQLFALSDLIPHAADEAVLGVAINDHGDLLVDLLSSSTGPRYVVFAPSP